MSGTTLASLTPNRDATGDNLLRNNPLPPPLTETQNEPDQELPLCCRNFGWTLQIFHLIRPSQMRYYVTKNNPTAFLNRY
jgi:hypothetical protein